MMLAEAVSEPGDWRRAFGAGTDDRFSAPTVRGVDFPTVGVRQAFNAGGVLTIVTYAATPTDGETTTFVVDGLPDASVAAVECDGRAHDRVRVVDRATLAVTCSVASHAFRVRYA